MTDTSFQLLRPFESDLRAIAAATLENGGVAFHVDRCQFLHPADIWTFPKYPGKTVILPSSTNLIEALRNFISANRQFLTEPDCWLGTWVHPVTGDFYLDIATGCEDLAIARETALEAGRREGRKIVAIYNSKRKETIYL